MNISDALRSNAQKLKESSPSSMLDAEILLAFVLGCDRTMLFTQGQTELNGDKLQVFETLITRRAQGEPIAYLVGGKEFYGLTFQVDSRVLVPRPETEILVESVLQYVKDHPRVTTLLDVGTGSGAIAISLAHAVKNIRVAACDISPEALLVAKANAHRLQVDVAFFESNLLRSIISEYDIVTANLPYIGHVTHADVEPAVAAYEPHCALFSGADGLDLYRELIRQLTAWQMPPQLLACEIAPGQGTELASFIHSSFPTAHITIKKDLAGLDRTLIATNLK